eukprot:1196067-Prorocentrum_minimum.AAC.3
MLSEWRRPKVSERPAAATSAAVAVTVAPCCDRSFRSRCERRGESASTERGVACEFGTACAWLRAGGACRAVELAESGRSCGLSLLESGPSKLSSPRLRIHLVVSGVLVNDRDRDDAVNGTRGAAPAVSTQPLHSGSLVVLESRAQSLGQIIYRQAREFRGLLPRGGLKTDCAMVNMRHLLCADALTCITTTGPVPASLPPSTVAIRFSRMFIPNEDTELSSEDTELARPA